MEQEQPSLATTHWVTHWTSVTLAIHVAIFLALLIFAAFVFPEFEAIFKGFKTEPLLLTRVALVMARGIREYWYLVVPLFLAADAGACLLCGQLKSRRLLVGWLICGAALLMLAGGLMFISLFLPALNQAR